MKYIFYHKNCSDGMGAALAAFQKFGYSDIKYVPCQHGQEEFKKHDLKNAEVWFLDFTENRTNLAEICDKALLVKVIDHHRTAQADLTGWKEKPFNLEINFDMSKSGAQLTWEYFNEEPCPVLINYIADRDLWTKKLPMNEEISAFIFVADFTLPAYEQLMKDVETDFHRCVVIGRSILQYQRKLVGMAMEQMRVEEDESGRKFATGNTSVLMSDIGNALLEVYPDIQYSKTYVDNVKLGTRIYSLRCRKDFDVSVIAKHYGGGGHAQAAGYTLKL